MKGNIVGREQEIEKLERYIASDESEFMTYRSENIQESDEDQQNTHPYLHHSSWALQQYVCEEDK